jgi:hypothetical protein
VARRLASAVVVLVVAFVAGHVAQAALDDDSTRTFLAFAGLVVVSAVLIAAPLKRWLRLAGVAVAIVAAMAVIFM